MKSETLVLRKPKIIGNSSDPTERYDLVFKTPYLAAYEITGSQLEIERPRNTKVAIPANGYTLSSKSIRVKAQTIGYKQAVPIAHLTIQYARIRSFRELFSYIEDNERRKRLAELAEEAEKSFDSEAWTSFTIMAAGVIEGVLGAFYGGKQTPYSSLLKTAYDSALISAPDYYVLDKLSESEKLIHASNFDIPFINKRTATKINRVYWKIIRTDWNNEA